MFEPLRNVFMRIAEKKQVKLPSTTPGTSFGLTHKKINPGPHFLHGSQGRTLKKIKHCRFPLIASFHQSLSLLKLPITATASGKRAGIRQVFPQLKALLNPEPGYNLGNAVTLPYFPASFGQIV